MASDIIEFSTELNDYEILCQKNIEERNQFMKSFFTDIKNDTQEIQELEEKRKQLKKRVVSEKPKISDSKRRSSQRLMLIEEEKIKRIKLIEEEKERERIRQIEQILENKIIADKNLFSSLEDFIGESYTAMDILIKHDPSEIENMQETIKEFLSDYFPNLMELISLIRGDKILLDEYNKLDLKQLMDKLKEKIDLKNNNDYVNILVLHIYTRIFGSFL